MTRTFRCPWRSRDVFADEAALGIAEAESRVVISGRQRVDFTAWAGSLANRLEEELRTIGVRRF